MCIMYVSAPSFGIIVVRQLLLCLQKYRNQPWSNDMLCVKVGLILINFEKENKGKSRVKLNYKAQVRNFHCAIY